MRTDILDIKEKHVEAKFVAEMKKIGALTYKFVSPNNMSVPDRIILLGGLVEFCELKRPGGKPTDKQLLEIARIRAQGGVVWTCQNYEEVAFLVDMYKIKISGSFQTPSKSDEDAIYGPVGKTGRVVAL